MSLLAVRELLKAYDQPGSPGRHPVVDVQEFHLEPGAQVALRGPL